LASAYLFFGGPSPQASDWNGPDAPRRIGIPGASWYSPNRGMLSSAGDVDGDGYGDFLINGTGSVAHLYKGSAAPSGTDWGSPSSPRRIDLAQPHGGGNYGFAAVGGASDVDGDGFSDFAIGEWSAISGNGAPTEAYVHLYLGGAKTGAADWNGTTAPRRIDLVGPELSTNFADEYGTTVALVGDVNGDGFGDLVAGAPYSGSSYGAAYLYLGDAAPSASDWNGATAPRRIDLFGLGPFDELGSTVAPAGDVDGDGYGDFLVGAIDTGVGLPNYGAARLYRGGPSSSATDWNGASAPRRVDLSSPDGQYALFSSALYSGGDVNGDGLADFAVGDGPQGPGVVHLYFGEPVPLGADWNGGTPPKRIDLAP
jgi:hypothetical protein